MGERIKKVRKENDLTQQDFGRRLGIKPNSVSLIESGNRNPSDQVILAICREFGVLEQWLREGTGEMFQPVSKEDELEAFLKKLSQDDSKGFKRRLVTVMARLNEEDWRGLENLAHELAEEFKEQPAPPDPAAEMADLKQRVEALEKEEAETPAPIPVRSHSH